MWLELAGGAAAWIAHVLWYVSSPTRCRVLGLGPRLGSVTASRLLRAASLLLVAASLGFWIRIHGAALGTCSALASLMAAASLNVVVAPLAPRGWLVFGGLAVVALLTGSWELLRGA